MGGTILFDAVNLVAGQKLKAIKGRKVMVLLTDGLDSGSRVNVEAAYKAALAADSVIYAIHNAPESTSGIVPAMESDDSGWKALRLLTGPTGGRTFRAGAKSPLTAAFQALEDDMRNQYALGYKPLNEATDGTFRKLEVKVRRSGVRAQTRSGYFALQK